MSELAKHPFSATGRFLSYAKPEPTVDLKLPVSIADLIVELLHREASRASLQHRFQDSENISELIAHILTQPAYIKAHAY